MTPMATTGEEAVGSMGNDTPISALSDKPKSLFTYFKQNFAQVTNPPIDPIREELVMSLVSIIGPRPNLFDLEGLSHTKRLEVRQPILTNADLEKIRSISQMSGDHFKSHTFDITFPAEHGADGMGWAIDALCEHAEEEVRAGCNIIILSDRKAGADRIQFRCCSPARRCIIISSARACAPRSGWSWRPASRARCIISPVWPATARKRSTPISPSRR